MNETKPGNKADTKPFSNDTVKEAAPSVKTQDVRSKLAVGGAGLFVGAVAGGLAGAKLFTGGDTPEAAIQKGAAIGSQIHSITQGDSQQGKDTPHADVDPQVEVDLHRIKDKFDESTQLMQQLRDAYAQIGDAKQELQSLQAQLDETHSKLIGFEAELEYLPQHEVESSDTSYD